MRAIRILAVVSVSAVALVLSSKVTAQAPSAPTSAARASSGDAGLWQLRSRHVVWGLPRQTDNRHNVIYDGEAEVRPGLSVLVREGFVVGHWDYHKIPAWVAVQWTRADYKRLSSEKYDRDFTKDRELLPFARANTSYNYSTSNMERGHMARHEDNEAWGEDNSDAGCKMSNVIPQHKDMNGEAWNDLEELHQDVVVDSDLNIRKVWIISGPIIEDSDGDGIEDPQSLVGNGVAVPQSTYKVIGWFKGDVFHARGYIVDQDDRVRNNPAHYLRSIDDIEEAAGLDFFPDLPEDRANEIESVPHASPWGTEGVTTEPTGVVRIASVLPNPVGSDTQGEAATISNGGESPLNLQGWKLRDASGKTWSLSGTIDAGDEIVVLRQGQPMALNNNGDTVELLNPDGEVVDSGSYASAQEGEQVQLVRSS